MCLLGTGGVDVDEKSKAKISWNYGTSDQNTKNNGFNIEQ
jgi:hypothetical protein